MKIPALAIQQANEVVPGLVPKIAGANLYLQSSSDGKSAVWAASTAVAAGITPTLFYADQATRRAATLTVGMLYSVARQTSDGSLWIVIPPLSGTTPVWGPLCSGPEATTSAAAYASLIPTAYQVLQIDKGLTYGGTTLAAGTTPPVGSLTGTLTGNPIPLLFKCTNAAAIGSGATFSAYADGVGTTPFMTGITPSAGVPVALTGVGAGLSHAWAAGTAALNNTWTATCSALADQSGNSNHAIQATASKQPIITIGLNGKVGLLFDGVDDVLDTAGLTLPITAVVFMVFRVVAAGSFKYIVDSSVLGNRQAIYIASSGVVSLNNGAQLDGSLATGSFARLAGTWDTSGTLKIGSNALVTGNSGTGISPGAGRKIGATGGGSYSNIELLALIYAPTGTALNILDSVINSASGFGVGGVLA